MQVAAWVMVERFSDVVVTKDPVLSSLIELVLIPGVSNF